MGAAIVGNTVLAELVCVIDVSVAARDGVVRRAIDIGEGHMVCSDQTMTAITNFGAPTDVDSRNRECVSRLFRRSMGDGYSQVHGRCVLHTRPFRSRDTIERDVKLGLSANLLRDAPRTKR